MKSTASRTPLSGPMGRPKKSAADRKKPISVALSPAVHKALCEEAKALGRSVSNTAEIILTDALGINNIIIKKTIDAKTRKP